MIIVYDLEDAERIDKYLADLGLPELYSRSYIEDLIDSGTVRVNGNVLRRKSYLLHLNDVVEVDVPPLEPTTVVPQDLPLDIVYEDDYLTVVNKPAGLIVHPGNGHPDGTLVNALVYHYGEHLSAGRHPLRPGIVHRLDKDTSGLLIVARDDRTHSLLSTMFADRQVEKYYRVITCGIPPVPEGAPFATITTNIDRSENDPRKMTVTDDGRLAITHYKVIDNTSWFALLEVRLETGRTHQIRVHMNYIHYPVFGDRIYSSLKSTILSVPPMFQHKVKAILDRCMQRQALHAFRLRFRHPILGGELDLQAPLPPDMAKAWESLKSLEPEDTVCSPEPS